MKKRFLNSEVIFGVVAIFVAVFFIVSGWKLPGETANGVPGSGYFPSIVAGGVIIFSMLLIIQVAPKSKDLLPYERGAVSQSIPEVGGVGGFGRVPHYLEILPAAMLYVFVLSRILKQPMKYSIPYTIIVVVVLYLIFSVAFRVKLNIY